MAYDAARSRVVMFGGMDGGQLFADTWEWDGSTWAQRTPTASPVARLDPAMAYDEARQRVVLFGGWNAPTVTLGDTWLWDGNDWLAPFPASSPPGRVHHAMAYDRSRQRVVLFGGWRTEVQTALADTWEWDGANWAQRFPANSPSPRDGHAMAFDPVRQRVVLFGGWASDTWEWDGTNWVERLPATIPPDRSNHQMAYDEGRQRIVLFGGLNSAGALGDTWEWDGTDWAQFVAASAPCARVAHAMAYDGARQVVVLLGGADHYGNFLADTWVRGNALVPAAATPFGVGCGVPPLGFVPDGAARPILGQTGGATIVDAPTPVAGVAMGWDNHFFGPYPLPVTLAGLGMPGCNLLHSSDVLGLATTPVTATSLRFAVTIPNLPVLLSSHAFLQAFAFAPGQNALQLIVSNAIDWRLGNL